MSQDQLLLLAVALKYAKDRDAPAVEMPVDALQAVHDRTVAAEQRAERLRQFLTEADLWMARGADYAESGFATDVGAILAEKP